MAEIILKPCPHCGGKAVITKRGPGFIVSCIYYDPEFAAKSGHAECHYSGTDFFESAEEAAAFWNSRPREDELLRRIEKLEQQIEEYPFVKGSNGEKERLIKVVFNQNEELKTIKKQLELATKEADGWHNEYLMCVKAWARELGPVHQKTHLIDTLVMGTRELRQNINSAVSALRMIYNNSSDHEAARKTALETIVLLSELGKEETKETT